MVTRCECMPKFPADLWLKAGPSKSSPSRCNQVGFAAFSGCIRRRFPRHCYVGGIEVVLPTERCLGGKSCRGDHTRQGPAAIMTHTHQESNTYHERYPLIYLALVEIVTSILVLGFNDFKPNSVSDVCPSSESIFHVSTPLQVDNDSFRTTQL